MPDPEKIQETAEEGEPEDTTVPEDELKVVIVVKAGRVMLGVQSPDCDPVYDTFEGDLKAALGKTSKLVEKARKQWGKSKLYPKANLPAPPAPAPSTRTTTPKQPEKPKAQPSFF